MPAPNYIKSQKGYDQFINHAKASSYSKSNNIFHEKIIIPPIKKPSNLMRNNNNSNNNDYFYHNYPLQQEFENYNRINNYYENQIKYFNNNNKINNINNNQYNTNNFISSRNMNETIINNIQTYNVPQNNDNFINTPTQRINRNLSQSSYYNNTNIFNQNSFPIDNLRENISLNSKLKPIENSKMINLKNFTIQKNGKTIGNIDINNDCQEIYLSNSNQITNSSSKNNYKIKDNTKPYYESFNLNNLNNKIKGKITNYKENKSKLINLSQSGSKTKNENNYRKHPSKVKMKTNNKIKISNNANLTKSASKKDNLNEAFYDNDILSVKLTSRKKNKYKIPYNNIKLFNESEYKNEIENRNINNNIEKSKEKKEKDEKEKKERMLKNISFNKKQLSYNEFQNRNIYNKIPVEKKNLKLDIKLPFNNLESSDIIDNKMDENINIENHIGNYTTISHTNTIDDNYGKETSKKNEQSKIIFNYKDNNNNSKDNNNATKQIIKIESNNQEKNKIPKNTIRRAKAKSKSNIFNKNFIKEITINKEEKISKSKEKKYSINTIKSMNQTFDKNKIKLPISLNNNKSEESIKTDRISHNKSPPKIINIKQSINKKSEKLNSSTNSENIVVGDLENEESKEIKINNFINKLENKFKTSISKDNEACENIYIINKSKMNISKNTLENNKLIEYKKDINYFRSCAYKSTSGKDSFGKRKINQDLYLVKINMNDIEGFNLFGVFDGHGQHGHLVSEFCRDYFIKRITYFGELCKQNNLKTPESIYDELKRTKFSYIKDTFSNADLEMSKQKNFDCNLSGAACNITFQFNKFIICASLGDCRGIITEEKDNSKLAIFKLSTDHKPNLPGELNRINLCGGMVDTKTNYPKIYKVDSNYPGLTISRSLGDLEAKKIGVISKPQIVEYTLHHYTKYLIICSRGVWEFIINEQVAILGNEFYKKKDCGGFCTDLVKLALSAWEKSGLCREDISVVCVFF